jgi:hypothetical protein
MSFICGPALSRRAAFSFHVDTCIFPRDKTGLTMGKPEVNLTFIPSLIHVYLRNSARVRQEVWAYLYVVDILRKRAFFLRKYVNRGMAFHRLVVVASLPATFPTLGRGHPNMTEQAALTRINLGQQTHILSSPRDRIII